jgi:hypothetical protein
MFQGSPENREETKHLNAKEHEREDMGSVSEPGG